MKFRFSVLLASMFLSAIAFAENGSVAIDVTLSPAGSFQAKTEKVTGTAFRTADGVIAENVVVALNTLVTGIELRDKHTRKHLEADKFPMAKLIKATGKDGKGEGILEIKGKKQKVSGTYKVDGNMLKASFKVHLPDVAITDVKYMGVGVEQDVMVNISLPLGAARNAASTNNKR